MRADSSEFLLHNDAPTKEPRYYVEIMYDDGFTDPYYFTSNSDVDLPAGATSANTYHGYLKQVQSTSQKLDAIKALSSIGNGSTTIADIGGAFSSLLNTKWIADKALRGKRFRTYVGYQGLANGDYSIVGTQEKHGHSFDGLLYKFSTEDIQRTVKKDIFDLNETTLTKSVAIYQISIPVTSTALFETNWHDANYSDSPTADVGYISLAVDDRVEIIKYLDSVTAAITDNGTDISFDTTDDSMNATSTDLSVLLPGMMFTITGSSGNSRDFIVNTTSTTKVTLYDLDGSSINIATETAGPSITFNAEIQFYNCTRGSLNTRAKKYDVDTTISSDRREKVLEHVYIETALPKIIYGILTGVWYGTANTLPSNWNLGIDTGLINSASFIDKPDLYDTSNESGKIFYFSGEEKIDAKEFIAEQCGLPIACYLRVLNDGDIALRRMTRTVFDASYVKNLNESDIVNVGNIKYDDDDVHNTFIINWNYEHEKGETTRTNVLVDSASVTKHGSADPIEFTFRGLHGSRHTLQTVYDSFNMLRDRYAGPPIKWSIKVKHKHNNLEIGDIIRVTINNVYDATNKVVTSMDRSFEVQGKTVDWITGQVTLNLFGSTEKAGLLSSTSVSTVMSDDFYSTATGLLAGNKLDSQLTMSGNNVTANGTLTGETSVTSNSKYWWDADLTINAGVTVSWTNNIHIYVKGHITLNGTLDGKFQGMTSGAGIVGNTKSGGALHQRRHSFGGILLNLISRNQGTSNNGTYDTVPYFAVEPDSAGDTLSGLPLDLRGSASPNGTATTWERKQPTGTLTGGTGVEGGGGMVIVCRGISAGGSGNIDSSGRDGNIGGLSTSVAPYTGVSMRAGSSGGGSPGGVSIFLDGNDSTNGLSDSNFIQLLGDTPLEGTSINGSFANINAQTNATYKSADIGFAGVDLNSAFWRVQYIPDTTSAVEDAPDFADKATAFASTTETVNSPPTSAQNLSTFQIDLTPPSDTNYQYSNIYYKVSTLSDSEYILAGPALDSVDIPNLVMDGATYDVIAKPVSKAGIESTDFLHTQITTANQKGGAVMATGNYIAVGQTAYDTGNGCWIEKTASGVKASFGDSAGDKVLINNDNADIIDITGTMSIRSNIRGANSYGSETIQVFGDMNDFSMVETLTNGSTVSRASGTYTFDNSTANTGADYASLYRNLSLTAASWGKDRHFKISCLIHNQGLGDLYISTGTAAGTVRRLGFRFDADGDLYAIWADGTTAGEQSVLTYSTGSSYKLEILLDAGTDAKFYVDDVLEHTETSNLPTGSSTALVMLELRIDKTDVSTATALAILVGDIKIVQEAS